MATLFSICGAIILSALAVGFAACGVAFARDRFGHWADRRYWHLRELILKEFGQRLHGDGWWFSEDPSAMHAVQCVADNLARNGGLNVDTARTEWRRKLAEGRAKSEREQADA